MTIAWPFTPLTNPYFEEICPTTQFVAGAIHLVGFGFDGTACFRKGTRHGPDAFRTAFNNLENYSPYLDRLLDQRPILDCGNLTAATESWQQASDDLGLILANNDIVQHRMALVTLGGEHSISYAPIVHYLQRYPDLLLIHLDAHADLRDGYEGYHYSHASIIRRVQEQFGPNHQLLQHGIRSGTKEEFDWMRTHRTLMPDLATLLTRVREQAPQRPIYVTLDLDYFDPAILPGTGTPEAGGESFMAYIELLKILCQKNFVGADIVELSPNIDATGNSSCFAAKILRETLLALS